jgi:hypothetical protein
VKAKKKPTTDDASRRAADLQIELAVARALDERYGVPEYRKLADESANAQTAKAILAGFCGAWSHFDEYFDSLACEYARRGDDFAALLRFAKASRLAGAAEPSIDLVPCCDCGTLTEAHDRSYVELPDGTQWYDDYSNDLCEDCERLKDDIDETIATHDEEALW